MMNQFRFGSLARSFSFLRLRSSLPPQAISRSPSLPMLDRREVVVEIADAEVDEVAEVAGVQEVVRDREWEDTQRLMVVNFLGGLAGIPSVLFLNAKIENTLIPLIFFAAACGGAFLNKIVETAAVENRRWWNCFKECFIATGSFAVGGGVPMMVESMIPTRWIRIVTSIGYALVFGAGALWLWNKKKTFISFGRAWKILGILVLGVAAITGLSSWADNL